MLDRISPRYAVSRRDGCIGHRISETTNHRRSNPYSGVNSGPQLVTVNIPNTPKLGSWIRWCGQWSTRIFDHLKRTTKEARNPNLDVLQEPGLLQATVVPPVRQDR